MKLKIDDILSQDDLKIILASEPNVRLQAHLKITGDHSHCVRYEIIHNQGTVYTFHLSTAIELYNEHSK